MPRLVYGFRSYFPCYPKTRTRIYSQRSLFIVCITADFFLEIFNSEGRRRRCAIQKLKLELDKFRLEICTNIYQEKHMTTEAMDPSAFSVLKCGSISFYKMQLFPCLQTDTFYISMKVTLKWGKHTHRIHTHSVCILRRQCYSLEWVGQGDTHISKSLIKEQI